MAHQNCGIATKCSVINAVISIFHTRNPIHLEQRFRARVPFSIKFNKAHNDCHLLTYFSLLAEAPTTPLSAGNRLLASLYTFAVTHEISHSHFAFNSFYFEHFQLKIILHSF